jgi:leader peptidase (prepilin peptidase)/N-methyltransferase
MTLDPVLDPTLRPFLAAVIAWLVFVLLQRWTRAELALWLTSHEADAILAASSFWRIIAFLLAASEVLMVMTLQGDWPSVGASLALGGLTGALTLAAMIDLRCRLLPDRITWLLVGAGLVVAWLGVSVTLGEALLGGLIGYGLPWLLALLSRKRRRPVASTDVPAVPMGRGDFALIAALGVWLGFSSLPLVLVVASLSMLPVAAWGMLRNGWQLSTALPFGPALSFAGLALLPWTDFGLVAR